jgi:hypothetical protein
MHTRIASVLALFALSGTALAQSAAFTYQGKLNDGGQPANGLHDFRFRLYDAPAGGAQVGAEQCADDLPVVNGIFTLALDFGNQFNTPAPRFIEVDVRRDTGLGCGDASGFTLLTTRQAITVAPLATHAQAAFSLDAADGSPQSAVFVDNAGRVGIGTTVPNFALHITANGPTLAIQDSATSSQQTGSISYRDNANSERAAVGFRSVGSPDFSIVNSRSAGNILLSSTGGGKILLNPNGTGNVGIGTSSPVSSLHILAPVPALTLQDQDNTSAQTGFISLRDSTGVEQGWMGYGTTANPHLSILNARASADVVLQTTRDIVMNTGGGERIRINTLGSVGIGITPVNFKLDVAGTVRCTTLTQTSSAAFKDDIAPLNAGLADLMKLQPVSYVWNDKAPETTRGKRDLGFIAEEVASVLPDAVAFDAEGKATGIDYSRITVLAVKAIKEQQAARDADRALIRSLQERLDRLEAKR